MTSRLKILLISLIIPAAAAAQLFPEQDILFERRLPGRNQLENSITCFLQDRQGFVWIGTKGGLFKYDGYHYQLFKMEPGSERGLSSSYIRCLHEHATEELLLIGTDRGGLNILDKRSGEITRYIHADEDTASIPGNMVYDILEDEAGSIWVATLEGGLCTFKLADGSFRRQLLDREHPDDLANRYVTCLHHDEKLGLLAGTKFSGIFRRDGESGDFHPVRDRLNRVLLREIWRMESDQRGNVWAGTQFNRICRITASENGEYSIDRYGSRRGVGGRHPVIDVMCDRGGTLWAGAWSGGLYRYNAEEDRFTQFRHSENNALSLSGHHVLALFEDRAGSIWIGTHARGINLIQTGRWKFYPHKFTQKHNYENLGNEVRSILSPAGSPLLWVGTSWGLMKFNTVTGDYTHFTVQAESAKGLLHNAVNAICAGEPPNILWLGTPVGLTRMNTAENSFRHYHSSVMADDAPLNINIFKIFKDRGGILWIGTSRIGLIRFDPQSGRFTRFTAAPHEHDSVMPWLVRDIVEAGADTLCLATSWGGYRFNTRTLAFVPLPENHPLHYCDGKSASVLCRDADGSLWVGTDGYGLIHYETGASDLLQLTEATGLGSDNVCGIMSDDNGQLFVSTDNGISYYDLKSGGIRNYGVEDGLHGTEFRNLAFTRGAGGKMYFGGIGGFTSLSQDDLISNRFVPPVYINQFAVLHTDFRLKQDMIFTERLELNHRMKSFTIGFVALNFINPQYNQYCYKLEGLDKAWQSAGNSREVTYRNINPGRYTFRVRGSNNDGFWNETGDALAIYIRPPFWQTAIFKIGLAALLLFIVYWLIRRRFENLRRESLLRRQYTHSLIRSQEQERKRIASELHDSLGQDLLVIKNRINMILKRTRGEGDHADHLRQVSAIADDTIAHIRQISFNLHPYQLDKIGLTDALKSMINKINEYSDITFRYRIDSIDGLLEKDQEINFYRILQELINNIIKHSKAETAEIHITVQKHAVTLQIEDDGIGFDYEAVNTEAEGFGLSGIRERIEILRGEMQIRTSAGKGTAFVITIPRGSNHE